LGKKVPEAQRRRVVGGAHGLACEGLAGAHGPRRRRLDRTDRLTKSCAAGVGANLNGPFLDDRLPSSPTTSTCLPACLPACSPAPAATTGPGPVQAKGPHAGMRVICRQAPWPGNRMPGPQHTCAANMARIESNPSHTRIRQIYRRARQPQKKVITIHRPGCPAECSTTPSILPPGGLWAVVGSLRAN
jgi:hypothetical protein